MNQQTVFPSGRIARWIEMELERDPPFPQSGPAETASGEAPPSANVRARPSLRYRPFQALAQHGRD
jgi:hypothetical protein